MKQSNIKNDILDHDGIPLCVTSVYTSATQTGLNLSSLFIQCISLTRVIDYIWGIVRKAKFCRTRNLLVDTLHFQQAKDLFKLNSISSNRFLVKVELVSSIDTIQKLIFTPDFFFRVSNKTLHLI